MKKKYIVEIICSLIAATGACIAGGYAGVKIERSNHENIQAKYIQSQTTNINGNNNTVKINDVDDLLSEYKELYDENKALRKQNRKNINELTESDAEIDNLKSQLEDTPIVELSDLSLRVNGNSIPINSTNAKVKINGREYFSREVAENLIDENQSIKVKNDTLYIGKIIAEQANLFDQWTNYSYDCHFATVKDSYGNTYANALYAYPDTEVTYSLENKYDNLKLVLAAFEGGSPDAIGVITIKCDGEVIYTSPEISILTKPFHIDIPIKACSLLTVTGGGSYGFKTIISDAIVYN